MRKKTIRLPVSLRRSVLSLGSQTKNTVCFARGMKAEIVGPLADLGSLDDFMQFNRRIKRLLKSNPGVVACDLHPEYQSSRLAYFLSPEGNKVYAVQHHYAHLVSCMAENGLKKKKAIGVACDGTGLGDDDKLWGFEFFLLDYNKYLRLGHLKYVPLIGSEAAIREPYRLALAWLYSIFGDGFMRLRLDWLKQIKKSQWHIFKAMLTRNINCPLSSSCGRLFDAVSSLIGIKHKIDYEAEAAIALQRAASTYGLRVTGYKFKVLRSDARFILDPAPMFRAIVADLQARKPANLIARRFHLTVARMILEVCRRIRKASGINTVVLSGGVFQNRILSDDTCCLLKDAEFDVITHRILKPDDSCISLGQAVVAGMKEN